MWHFTKSINLTAFLAVWGAILSSFTFGWTLYRDLRDRARIIISARLRQIGRRDGDGAWFASDPGLNIAQVQDGLYVMVSVTNVGRRRMRWKGLGGTYRKAVNGRKNFVVSARHLPKVLEEQEALDEFFDLDEQFVTNNVRRLFIWDGAGREWSIPRQDLKKIVADAKKYAVRADQNQPN